MVFAVRCPAPKCRKYMLVEPADAGRVIACLVCKQPVHVPTTPGPPAAPLPDDLEVSDTPPAGLPVARPLP